MHKHGCGDTCTCPEPHHYLCMAERYAAEWWRVVNGGGTSKEIHANWKLAQILLERDEGDNRSAQTISPKWGTCAICGGSSQRIYSIKGQNLCETHTGEAGYVLVTGEDSP